MDRLDISGYNKLLEMFFGINFLQSNSAVDISEKYTWSKIDAPRRCKCSLFRRRAGSIRIMLYKILKFPYNGTKERKEAR